MGQYISLIALGALLVALGAGNIRGNISTIHWYNRARVREEDRPAYGRWMGVGTAAAGGGILLTGLLQLVFPWEGWYVLTLVGCVAGVAVILRGQWKYNGGLF